MRLYSSLSRRKEELPPATQPDGTPTRIGMYFCGPTVYQRIHVGNARPFVISMWLRNWLRQEGYDVTLVENITDINDKIYDAAPGHSAQLAADASRWYVEDTDLLGLGRPDVEPKASETIPEIIALIEELVARGAAYEAGGDVYFRVARFPDYGRLSGQRPDEVQEQEPNPLKEDPRDFALWKATKPGEDTWWESPWGRGRPGWHIECSAMAEKYLGPSFCIHGGGLDLIFPHHENEIAQSRAAGREFARIWMHNGMLRLTGEKMSKSLGNIEPLRDVIEEWGRETLLLFFLTAHWRSPIDFSKEVMRSAEAQFRAFRNAMVHVGPRGQAVGAPPWSAFRDALNEDFNTPNALAVLHEWRAAGATTLLHRGLEVFDLHRVLHVEPGGAEAAHGAGGTAMVEREIRLQASAPPEIEAMARERLEARRARDFQRADSLRRKIEEAGWEIRDIAESPGYQLLQAP